MSFGDERIGVDHNALRVRLTDRGRNQLMGEIPYHLHHFGSGSSGPARLNSRVSGSRSHHTVDDSARTIKFK